MPVSYFPPSHFKRDQARGVLGPHSMWPCGDFTVTILLNPRRYMCVFVCARVVYTFARSRTNGSRALKGRRLIDIRSASVFSRKDFNVSLYRNAVFSSLRSDMGCQENRNVYYMCHLFVRRVMHSMHFLCPPLFLRKYMHDVHRSLSAPVRKRSAMPSRRFF